MPRIFMSVLAAHRVGAARRDGAPALAFARRGAFAEQREERQDEEVLDRENRSADDAGERAGDAEVGVPEPGQARAPQLRAVPLRRDADELRERVVHMKLLVVKDVVEDALRLRIGAEDVAVDGEAGRRPGARYW